MNISEQLPAVRYRRVIPFRVIDSVSSIRRVLRSDRSIKTIFSDKSFVHRAIGAAHNQTATRCRLGSVIIDTRIESFVFSNRDREEEGEKKTNKQLACFAQDLKHEPITFNSVYEYIAEYITVHQRNVQQKGEIFKINGTKIITSATESEETFNC